MDDFVTKGLEQLQAQQSDAQIVDELESSDNWDAIRSDRPLVVDKSKTIDNGGWKNFLGNDKLDRDNSWENF